LEGNVLSRSQKLHAVGNEGLVEQYAYSFQEVSSVSCYFYAFSKLLTMEIKQMKVGQTSVSVESVQLFQDFIVMLEIWFLNGVFCWPLLNYLVLIFIFAY
jgi:hypothetical protein